MTSDSIGQIIHIFYDYIQEQSSSILYSTTRDVTVISQLILANMSQHPNLYNVSPRIIDDQLDTTFKACQSLGVSKKAEKSFAVFIVRIKACYKSSALLPASIERFLNTLHESLCDFATCNLTLDCDGKKQLCRDATRGLYHRGIRLEYLKANFSTRLLRDQAYAIEMKVRFHKLQLDRDENLLPQNDSLVLKKLFARDLNLLNAFPNLLLKSKVAVLIAIAHLQSQKTDDSDLDLDFSKLDDQLRNDRDIFLAAVKSPKTSSLVELASPELKKNEPFFHLLVKRRGGVLCFADDVLKDRVDVVCSAIFSDASAIAFASSKVQERTDTIVDFVRSLSKKSDE